MKKLWSKKYVLVVISSLICFVLAESVCFFLLEKWVDQKLDQLTQNIHAGEAKEEIQNKLGDPVNLDLHTPMYPHPFFGYTRPLTKMNASLEAPVYGFVERPELWNLKKHPDTLYIGIFGGSVAAQAASFEKIHHILSGELRKHLKKLNKKNIRILNFAYSGYKQPQQFAIASFYLDKLDVSINIEGANESKVLLNSDFPLYFPTSLVSSLYFSRDIYQNKRNQNQLFTYYLEVSYLQHKWKAPKTQLSLVRTIVKLLTFILWEKILKIEAEFATSESGPWKRERQAEVLQNNVKLWAKFVKQQEVLARAQKVTSLYVLQPIPYIAQKRLTEDEKKFISKINPQELELRKLSFSLFVKEANMLAQEGLPVVDFNTIFSKTTEAVFVDGCCHLNQKGNTLFLEQVAKSVVKQLSQKRP